MQTKNRPRWLTGRDGNRPSWPDAISTINHLIQIHNSIWMCLRSFQALLVCGILLKSEVQLFFLLSDFTSVHFMARCGGKIVKYIRFLLHISLWLHFSTILVAQKNTSSHWSICEIWTNQIHCNSSFRFIVHLRFERWIDCWYVYRATRWTFRYLKLLHEAVSEKHEKYPETY